MTPETGLFLVKAAGLDVDPLAAIPTRHADAGRHPRLSRVRLKKGVDADLRQHDDVADADTSLPRPVDIRIAGALGDREGKTEEPDA